MNPQTIEISPLARHVTAESLAVLRFQRIYPAALDSDVVADGHRQGVNHVVTLGAALGAVLGALAFTTLLEYSRQKREQSLPHRGVDGVQSLRLKRLFEIAFCVCS